MNNNGSVVSFCSKFALFQRGKFRITLLLWPEMKVERVMGIEPTSRAWEAHVLPLYDTRNKDLDSAKEFFLWQPVRLPCNHPS